VKKLVVASSNPGKLAEIRTLLGPLGIEVVSQGELGIADAEEPHFTFLENALAKARHASRACGLAALADDSGICVDALGGEPGVNSAYFAGMQGERAERDAKNNAKLLEVMAHDQRPEVRLERLTFPRTDRLLELLPGLAGISPRQGDFGEREQSPRAFARERWRGFRRFEKLLKMPFQAPQTSLPSVQRRKLAGILLHRPPEQTIGHLLRSIQTSHHLVMLAHDSTLPRDRLIT